MATFGSRSSLELSSPQRLRLRSCFRRDSAKSAIDVTERCTISVLIITDVRMCNKTLRWTVLPKYDDEFYINPHFCQQSLHHSPPSSSHSYTPALIARVRVRVRDFSCSGDFLRISVLLGTYTLTLIQPWQDLFLSSPRWWHCSCVRC
jgi:hypothetical protein